MTSDMSATIPRRHWSLDQNYEVALPGAKIWTTDNHWLVPREKITSHLRRRNESFISVEVSKQKETHASPPCSWTGLSMIAPMFKSYLVWSSCLCQICVVWRENRAPRHPEILVYRGQKQCQVSMWRDFSTVRSNWLDDWRNSTDEWMQQSDKLWPGIDSQWSVRSRRNFVPGKNSQAPRRVLRIWHSHRGLMEYPRSDLLSKKRTHWRIKGRKKDSWRYFVHPLESRRVPTISCIAEWWSNSWRSEKHRLTLRSSPRRLFVSLSDGYIVSVPVHRLIWMLDLGWSHNPVDTN